MFQPLPDGKASGKFVHEDPGEAAHRPSGVEAGPDGALYISDDQLRPYLARDVLWLPTGDRDRSGASARPLRGPLPGRKPAVPNLRKAFIPMPGPM